MTAVRPGPRGYAGLAGGVAPLFLDDSESVYRLECAWSPLWTAGKYRTKITVQLFDEKMIPISETVVAEGDVELIDTDEPLPDPEQFRGKIVFD